MSKDIIIEIRPYTIKSLAVIYGVHRDTMNVWLSRISHLLGEKVGYYYSIPQVKIIFTHLDLPSNVTIKESFN